MQILARFCKKAILEIMQQDGKSPYSNASRSRSRSLRLRQMAYSTEGDNCQSHMKVVEFTDWKWRVS